ncbi:MAG: NADH-quinone oxidoreductase subunit J [Candidatus Sumerlaeia bacterium]|nr:NADH-quinone oxidoreductase subunit J [Candidatus Sumerlaeia bacterium]
MIATLVIAAFMILAMAGAIYAALVPHTLHCIIGLGLTLFGVAGIYLYLGSPFVAAMQILIYIGGISVAMVFALMLSVSLAKKMKHSEIKVILSSIAAILFLAVMARLIMTTEFPLREEPAGAAAWGVEQIGHGFLTTYSPLFIGLAICLSVAIIAAVLVARREADKS